MPADARALVEGPDTGDRMDPVIGDRTFKTKSSEELYHLTLLVEWAKAARLLRTAGGRLLPVKKNARLLDHPAAAPHRTMKDEPSGHAAVHGRVPPRLVRRTRRTRRTTTYGPTLCPRRPGLERRLHGDEAHSVAAELRHVVDVRGEHDDRAALTQRRLGHGSVDGVLVTMQPSVDQHG